jgi:hypothetical protein
MPTKETTIVKHLMLETHFWRKAANSLPAAVRERYVGDFKTAERCEFALDAIIAAWRRCRIALERLSQALLRTKHGRRT